MVPTACGASVGPQTSVEPSPFVIARHGSETWPHLCTPDECQRALGRRRLAFAVSRNADYGSSLNAIVPFYGNRSFQIPSEHLVVKGLGSKVFFCLTDRT